LSKIKEGSMKPFLIFFLILFFLFSAKLFCQIDDPDVRPHDQPPYQPKFSLWSESPTSTPEPTITPNPYVWYPYEPNGVKLTGTVVNVKAYGPPNFGETPDKDEKLNLKVLKLDQPINVKGNTNDEIDDEDVLEVTEIEIDTNINLNPRLFFYVGKKVEVEGTLEHREAGAWITEVLLDLKKISLKH
jgi:hypothetical protein